MVSAYLAGGCFWCITPDFAGTEGVSRVTAGYCGGTEAEPTYADVKAQRTGHRETIRIDYDPERVSFRALCHMFLELIDPFDGGGQFIDRGHSYTTAIYYASEKERTVALDELRALAQREGREPQVAVEPLGTFWDAEEYHQDYYLKEPEAFAEELRVSGRLERGTQA